MPSRRGRRARIARREERYWVDDDDEELYGPVSVARGGTTMAYILRDSGEAGVVGGSRRTVSRLSQSSPGADYAYDDGSGPAQSGGLLRSGAAAKDGVLIAVLAGPSTGQGDFILNKSVLAAAFPNTSKLGRAIASAVIPDLSDPGGFTAVGHHPIEGYTNSQYIGDGQPIIEAELEYLLVGVELDSRNNPDADTFGVFQQWRAHTGGVSESALPGAQIVNFDFGLGTSSTVSVGNVALSGDTYRIASDFWGQFDSKGDNHIANNEFWEERSFSRSALMVRELEDAFSGSDSTWHARPCRLEFRLA